MATHIPNRIVEAYDTLEEGTLAQEMFLKIAAALFDLHQFIKGEGAPEPSSLIIAIDAADLVKRLEEEDQP